MEPSVAVSSGDPSSPLAVGEGADEADEHPSAMGTRQTRLRLRIEARSHALPSAGRGKSCGLSPLTKLSSHSHRRAHDVPRKDEALRHVHVALRAARPHRGRREGARRAAVARAATCDGPQRDSRRGTPDAVCGSSRSFDGATHADLLARRPPRPLRRFVRTTSAVACAARRSLGTGSRAACAQPRVILAERRCGFGNCPPPCPLCRWVCAASHCKPSTRRSTCAQTHDGLAG
jgi:hypothetical protein